MSCGSEATQCSFSGWGDADVPPAPEIQTEDHSRDLAGHRFWFYSVFPGFLTAIRQIPGWLARTKPLARRTLRVT